MNKLLSSSSVSAWLPALINASFCAMQHVRSFHHIGLRGHPAITLILEIAMFARILSRFLASRDKYVWLPALAAPTGSALSTLLHFG